MGEAGTITSPGGLRCQERSSHATQQFVAPMFPFPSNSEGIDVTRSEPTAYSDAGRS
ncbi:hypothetical protein ACIBKY_41175 [Nonomuraea sp. NPDC050394]|uniref:hypothetical protein n=1 Tax=Nonomuraea sp. NPDC050394 TaxID=3364363 RepID=UPI0037B792A1